MKFLPLVLLIPFVAFAQANEVMIGDASVDYDERVETETGVLYFSEGSLVASEHDNDGNGETDTWLKYTNEVVDLEVTDTDGDGTGDVFATIAANGEVANIEGDGAAQCQSRRDHQDQGGATEGGADDSPPVAADTMVAQRQFWIGATASDPRTADSQGFLDWFNCIVSTSHSLRGSLHG